MADKILNTFLERQLEQARELNANSDILELEPVRGNPPTHYIAMYHARGLIEDSAGKVADGDRFMVGIAFGEDYLRCGAANYTVLTCLGPPKPWHPNILGPAMCVNDIQGPAMCVELLPGMTLRSLVFTCYDLWTWRFYATGDDGLNPAAAAWARRQQNDRFPTDPRPLLRRVLAIEVEPVG